jgi:hypothetical protein
MYKLTLLIVTGMIVSSCVNTKKYGLVVVPAKQKLYKRVENGANPQLHFFETNKSIKAKIKEDDKGFLVLNPIVDATRIKVTKPFVESDKGASAYYHTPQDENQSSGFNNGAKFIYYEMSPIFQAITIPFKYVPKNGSLPYQVSTGINTGFAYGWKISRNSFRRSYYGTTFLNTVKRQYSITPGIFLGPTTVKLTAATTDGFINADRTVLGFNTGLITVIGIGKFNVGVATGWDDAWGAEGNRWIYDGKQWYGVVIALDFIK